MLQIYLISTSTMERTRFRTLTASTKGSNNDLLQTPSPISENDPLPATQQSPTAFLTEVLQTTKIAKKIRTSTPPEARVRIDVFVSLRNNGQKVDTTRCQRRASRSSP
jgi:hypothetical protein